MRVRSAEVFAFDFIEDPNYDSFIESVKEELDLEPVLDENPPNGLIGSGGMSVNHLGVLQLDESSFSEIYASVIGFSSTPGIYTPLLLGKTSEEQIGGNADMEFDAQELQNELGEIWSEFYPDFESAAQGDSPMTLFSAQITVDDLSDQFPIPEDGTTSEDLATHSPFLETVRDEAFCRQFGIEWRGLMSLQTDCEQFLVLTAQGWWTSSGDQVQHGGYAMIEFVTEDDPFSDTPDIGPVMGALGGPGRVQSRLQNLIPLLFYFYWFKKQIGYEKPVFGSTLRDMPLGIDDERDLNEIMDALQEKGSEFYGQYVTFLDKADAAKTLIDRLSNATSIITEEGVPLLSDQRPPARVDIEGIDYEFDYHAGIFNLLMTDVQESMQDAKQEYAELQDRYEIVLEELNQQLNLHISEQNRELAESSVDLQEDMKEMTQSSLNFQQRVTWLTRWVAVLTLVLVIDAVGVITTISEFAARQYGPLASILSRTGILGLIVFTFFLVTRRSALGLGRIRDDED